MSIFKTYAQNMWDHGLPVIPLRPRSKAALAPDWTKWCREPLPANVKAEWLLTYPNSNIGLPLGPSANLVAVDVDTTDPHVIALIEKHLPPSPWKRIGKKGFVSLYRYSGEQSEQIKDSAGGVVLELLGDGRQVVLPPSIHPDTGQPYSENRALVSVLQDVTALPSNFMKSMRETLTEEGVDISRKTGLAKISEFVPEGARDTAMTAHAGILARAVVRAERTLAEAFSELDHWCDTYAQKVAGDDVDRDKGKQRIVQFLQRDIMGPRKVNLPKGWDDGLTDEAKSHMQILFTSDHEQWDKEQILTYLTTAFTEYAVDDPKRALAIDHSLEKIARSPQIDNLERERILKWIKDASSMGDSIVALRRRVSELSQGDIAGADHAEIAQTVMEDLNQIGEVRFDRGKFWQWGGAHWNDLEPLVIKRRIVEDYGSMPLARRANDHTGIIRTMEALCAKKLQQINIPGINFANGFLTSELELLPHNPDFGAVFALPYRYLGENAPKCPKFLEFLHKVWGKDPDYEQKVMACKEAFGATLFGLAPQLSRAICLYGVGNSGKTQLLEILENMLPGYAVSSINPADWGDKFLPAPMSQSALNLCGELSEDKRIDGDFFKRIVEGGTISAQFKNRPIFEFKPKCAQWFASNYLPRTRDASFGFGRRWLFLSFSRVIPIREKKPKIGFHIASEEREAIAAWAVQAIPELLERGEYTMPPSSDGLMTTMLAANCTVRNWLANSGLVKVTNDPTDIEQESRLYECYRVHCNLVLGNRSFGRGKFSERMHMMMSENSVERTVVDQKEDRIEYKGLKIIKMLKRM